MPYKRKGTKNYWIIVDGLRRTAGTSNREDAAELERRLNSQAWQERRLGVKPPRSWKEACVRWVKEKADKRSLQDDIDKIRWLDSFLCAVEDIQKITREFIDGILSSRSGVSGVIASPANSTANRYVALVQSILTAAEREWEWGNRAPKLKKYPEPNTEQRWLTVTEWRRLKTELPEYLKLAAGFSLSTGMREAKVFGLKWQTVNMQKKTLVFTGVANKIGASIPLNATAIAVLMECRYQQIISPEFVFLREGKPIPVHAQTTWAAAFKRAGVEYMKWHGLRHTFNTWLANEGVPREIRMRLMGHSDGSVHGRYTHHEIEALRPYSEVIDRILDDDTRRSDKSTG